MRFKNPKNGDVTDLYDPVWVVVLLFGVIYFAYKKLWLNAILSLSLAIFTVGISWFFYPFFAKSLIRWEYKQRRWLDRTDGLGDIEHRGTYADDVVVQEGDCEHPYRKIARVEASTYKPFPFSPEPSVESVAEKLRDEAMKVGANRVINVSYRRKSSTWIGWGALIGEGIAVRVELEK